MARIKQKVTKRKITFKKKKSKCPTCGKAR